MRLSIARFTLLLAIFCWLPVAETSAQSHSPELDQHGRWVNKISEPWWFPEKLSKDHSAAAQSRWEAIAPAKTSVWSGDYFTGSDTHGSYLRWSAESGFVIFHVDKCAASVTGFSYGTVEASANLVKLLVEKSGATATGHGHSAGTSESVNFLPVIWRETRYLVPENQIEEFSDYITGRGKFNDSSIYFSDYLPFFSKSGESLSTTEESDKNRRTSPNEFEGPHFPPGYEKFIKKPINAIITTRGKGYVRNNSENEWWNDLVIPVSLNAGTNQGLKVGMVLRVVEAEFDGEEELVKITSVTQSSAKGIIERPVRKVPCVKFEVADDCANPEYRPIRVGSRLTTNPIRN